jgi:hypothetical protein
VDQGAAIADVLSALVDGDTDRARTAADKAAAAGGSPLVGALAAYLSAAAETASVYTEPTAFEAFIHGGGNVGLYRAVSAVLAERYDLLRRPPCSTSVVVTATHWHRRWRSPTTLRTV